MYFEKFEPNKGKMLQIIDEKGKLKNKSLLPNLEDEQLIEMLRTMITARTTDETMMKLQRQGRMPTFPPNLGQEAVIGSAVALEKGKDWMVITYRELAAWLYFGMPLESILTYWSGSELGSKIPEDVNMTPISVPLATQCQHAAGIAFANKYQKNDKVTLCYIGDGATSQGDFHEAINFCAINETASVFVIQNNQWAISTPISIQTKSKTFAGKGEAYGVRGIVVDGNDALAVYAATKEAIDLARAGKGPSIIEMYTYRMGPHTTSDDPSVYRDEAITEEWRKKDPIDRLEAYLIEKGAWTPEQSEKLREEVVENFKTTFEKVEKMEDTPLEEVFNYIYANRTPDLQKQYEERKAYYEATK
ncbi:MAG: pyruvate dehydrogenase (acetyl-transferring) E1 component subunit alpha [Bacillota bacterium]|nr:pyruvate dehydrogenase (acetyl-transferring) E1 component subunit alpha [Bacillota bacterium]